MKTVHRSYEDIAEVVGNLVKNGCYAPTHCPHRSELVVTSKGLQIKLICQQAKCSGDNSI